MTARRRTASWPDAAASRGLRVAVVVAIAAFLLVLVPQPTFAAVDLVTPTGGEARVFDSSTETVSFPVTPAGSTPLVGAEVSVTAVVLEDVALSSSSVIAGLDIAAGVLTLTFVDHSTFAEQGVYKVSVKITAPAGATEPMPATQTLSLTLKREAAEIDAGGTVQVTRYVGWLDDAFPALFPVVEPPLELPLGDAGELVSISAVQAERSSGSITLKTRCNGELCPVPHGSPMTLSEPIAPHGVLGLGYDLADFPLGTTERTVTIDSPQLAAPVPVKFAVKTALSPVWIPIIVVAGLLVGYLVRVWIPMLSRWAQRRRVRVALLRIANNVRALYLGLPPDPGPRGPADPPDNADPELWRALRDIVAILRPRSTPRDVVDLQLVALRDALEAANKRLTDAQTVADGHGAKVSGAWMLPPDVKGRLTAARVSVNEALAAVQERRLRLAKDKNTEAEKALREIVEESNAWVQRYVDSVKDLAAEIPSDTQAADPTEIETLRSMLAKVMKPSETVAADPQAALSEVSNQMERWEIAIKPVLLAAATEMQDADREAADELRTAFTNPNPVEAMNGSEGAFQKLILAHRSPTPSESTEEPPSSFSPAEVEVEAEPGEAPKKPEPPELSSVLAIPGASLDGSSGGGVYIGIGWAAQTLRFVVLAIVACLVAFWVGQDDWTGAGSQLFIVFGFAFTLDLTTDKVTALFGAGATLPKLTSSS